MRWFVGQGSGLDSHVVIPGNSPGQRPKATYATVLLLDDQRRGYPVRRQEPLGGGTTDLIYRRATFSVQFYRKDAASLAERFDRWAMSENGLSQAATSFSDGRINRVRVLRSGAGYSDPSVTFSSGGGGGATARATIISGAVAGVTVTGRGEGYVIEPDIAFPDATGSGAFASCVGYGFRVVFPLELRRLDEIAGAAFEERVQLDLPIDYATFETQDTGDISDIECTVTMEGAGSISREVSIG